VTKKKGLFRSLFLAAVLATGFWAVWLVAVVWGVEVGSAFMTGPSSPKSLLIDRDGTALIMSAIGDEPCYTDLDGNPVTRPAGTNVMQMYQTVTLPPEPARGEDAADWSARVWCFNDGEGPATLWYLVTDGQAAGTGYFVGYDGNRKTAVGYIGTAGFRPDLPPPEDRFPVANAFSDYNPQVVGQAWRNGHTGHIPGSAPRRPGPGSLALWDVYVVGRDDRLYHVDLQERTVTAALSGVGVRGVGMILEPGQLEGVPRYRLAVRTADEMRILNARCREQARYPIPDSLHSSSFTFAETTLGEAVFHTTGKADGLDKTVDHAVWWVRPDGATRTARVTLPVDPPLLFFQQCGAAIAPVPAIQYGPLGVYRVRGLLNSGLAATVPQACLRALREFAATLALTTGLAAVLAWVCYRRQVRYGASRVERWVWPLFVFLFGLPGWVGYRFARTWPVLEECPTCYADVPRDREWCDRCTEEFPRPALKGTEVFA
jgi:hypothetical protein